MSVKRRLGAAAMPAAGVTVVAAALALSGQPASAAMAEARRGSVAVLAAAPRVDCDALATVNIANEACEPGSDAATTDHRGEPGYGDGAGESPDDGYDDGAGGDNGGGSGAEGPGDDEGPIRGNDGYGETPPPGNETPPPGGNEVPPGGEGPGELPPGGVVSPGEVPIPGRGAGAGDTLPVTGSPVVVLGVIGGLLTAGGAAIRVAVRRRRA